MQIKIIEASQDDAVYGKFLMNIIPGYTMRLGLRGSAGFVAESMCSTVAPASTAWERPVPTRRPFRKPMR